MFMGAAIFQGIVESSGKNLPIWALILAYFATLAVHELLHGLGFLIGGAKPRFGVGVVGILPLAYATSDHRLPLKNMLVVAYLPFVALSIVFIALAYLFPEYSALFMVGFVGNFSGAIGDIWIASKMLKYLRFKDAMVLDTKTGTNVYSDSPEAAESGLVSMEKEKATTPFWKVAGTAFFLIAFISVIVPIIMLWSGFSGYFKLGYGELYLFMVNNSDAETVAAFNLLPAVVGGLLAGVTFNTLERHNKGTRN